MNNMSSTFYSNDQFAITVAELESTIISTLNAEVTVAAGLDSMKRSFLSCNAPKDGETTNWELYCSVVGQVGSVWFDQVRTQLIEDYLIDCEIDESTKWTDIPGFSKVQTGFSAFRQKVERQTLGYGFKVATKWSIQDFEVAANPVSGFEVTTPKAIVEKPAKPAAGKSKSAAAKGADIPSAESGATMLETLTGDRNMAKAALLEALKAFPELTAQKSVIQAFQNAVDKNDLRIAAKKAA